MEYVIVGKPFAKVRMPDGSKQRVAKKIHILRDDGKTFCQVENSYKTAPARQAVLLPEESDICKNCLALMMAEPRLSVLMGEAV